MINVWNVGQGKHHRGSHHDHDRQSIGKQSEGHVPSVVEYENTYKLAPDSRFQETQVRSLESFSVSTVKSGRRLPEIGARQLSTYLGSVYLNSVRGNYLLTWGHLT